jgi:hypothetical protein
MDLSKGKNSLSFVLSFIGGLIILLGGIVSTIWFVYGGAVWGDFGEMWSGFMGGYHGMMGSLGFPFGFMGGFSLIGLICGAIIVISAWMFTVRPEEGTWAILILIFSAISFLNMGGFMIGGILGLIGGSFAYNQARIEKVR